LAIDATFTWNGQNVLSATIDPQAHTAADFWKLDYGPITSNNGQSLPANGIQYTVYVGFSWIGGSFRQTWAADIELVGNGSYYVQFHYGGSSIDPLLDYTAGCLPPDTPEHCQIGQ
jgi:hypothetical protein